jgi:hypothetical protein
MSAERETKQAEVVGVCVVIYTRELEHVQVQQRSVPMTPKQAMTLVNFIKHRLHGGRLTLDKLPEERRIITL